MKIYNSLTKRKEEFIPLEGKKVKMYACGITVSGEAHIGHGYQALIYDIMRKYLVKKGYDVTYARNYTDVDDKIIAKANELNATAQAQTKELRDLTNKYVDNMLTKVEELLSNDLIDVKKARNALKSTIK